MQGIRRPNPLISWISSHRAFSWRNQVVFHLHCGSHERIWLRLLQLFHYSRSSMVSWIDTRAIEEIGLHKNLSNLLLAYQFPDNNTIAFCLILICWEINTFYIALLTRSKLLWYKTNSLCARPISMCSIFIELNCVVILLSIGQKSPTLVQW